MTPFACQLANPTGPFEPDGVGHELSISYLLPAKTAAHLGKGWAFLRKS